MIVSTKDVANFFGISDRQVRNWESVMGCPKRGDGQWDLKAVFDWWWENIAQDRAATENKSGALSDAKRVYWTAKAKSAVLDVQEREKGLVAWDQIEKEWAERVGVVTSGLSMFADRLPPVLEGKTQLEMREVIRAEVRILRESYARNGKYCPKSKDFEEYEKAERDLATSIAMMKAVKSGKKQAKTASKRVKKAKKSTKKENKN